ncbi:MAG: hypothetical protein LJE83_09265 [Gammaproteobacteria bacterium]|nr:hypothetical protein [Gammaproteobacteria bacterium]
MIAFADETGLTNTSRAPRRYLWTDAFAVCNYIELYRQTNKPEYLQLAEKLVDQVHHVLGRNRENSAWLSGLNDEQASRHPTQGGLRIGKKLDERQQDEVYDDHLEWDRDGQYFHYLTKWMHALNCLSRATGNSNYNRWAMELAQVSYTAFTYTPATGNVKRMYWKMSTDLSRPLVYSMGHHDPLDGLITCQQLQATAKQFPQTPGNLSLDNEIKEYAAMCDGVSWATRDTLGIGGLLIDAYRLVQLIGNYHLHASPGLELLLLDIERSMQAFASLDQDNPLNLPAEYRLAFRELGLAIGLSAINKMQTNIEQHPAIFTSIDQVNSSLKNLSRYYPVYDLIKDFWLKPQHRSVDTWLEHADINNVMLATCLAPDSFLKI